MIGERLSTFFEYSVVGPPSCASPHWQRILEVSFFWVLGKCESRVEMSSCEFDVSMCTSAAVPDHTFDTR